MGIAKKSSIAIFLGNLDLEWVEGSCSYVAPLPKNGSKSGWATGKGLYLGHRIFPGWVRWKSCNPICSAFLTKTVVPKQKNDFWPQISIFGSKLHPFLALVVLIQFFQHKKGILLVPRYEGTKNFGPRTAKFGWYWPFWPIWCHTLPNTMWTRCLGGYLCGYQRFWSHPPKNRINGPKTAILAPK